MPAGSQTAEGLRLLLWRQESDLRTTYDSTRSSLGAEVKRRIFMGTYALSSGYYDAYYQRAQKVGPTWRAVAWWSAAARLFGGAGSGTGGLWLRG